jgi:hypothetical protein
MHSYQDLLAFDALEHTRLYLSHLHETDTTITVLQIHRHHINHIASKHHPIIPTTPSLVFHQISSHTVFSGSLHTTLLGGLKLNEGQAALTDGHLEE